MGCTDWVIFLTRFDLRMLSFGTLMSFSAWFPSLNLFNDSAKSLSSFCLIISVKSNKAKYSVHLLVAKAS